MKGGAMATGVVQEQAMEQSSWWLILLEGIALILVGIFLLMDPDMTSIIVVTFIGIYWLIAGIFRIINVFIDKALWGWNLTIGILGIAAGVIVIRHPVWSTTVVGNTLIIIMGFMGIGFGLGSIISGVQGKRWGTSFLGIISIFIGLALLANVWLFTFSLPYALGALAILGGIAAMGSSLKLK